MITVYAFNGRTIFFTFSPFHLFTFKGAAIFSPFHLFPFKG